MPPTSVASLTSTSSAGGVELPAPPAWHMGSHAAVKTEAPADQIAEQWQHGHTAYYLSRTKVPGRSPQGPLVVSRVQLPSGLGR